MDCLFCNIIKRNISSKILYEDDLVIVIMDAFPNVDGHSLIISKKHYTDLFELDDNLILHINRIAKDMTSILLEKLNATSMTMQTNYGDHQIIKHFHLHLLPDYPKNKGKQKIEKIFNIIAN